jgi:hypothetical protein
MRDIQRLRSRGNLHHRWLGRKRSSVAFHMIGDYSWPPIGSAFSRMFNSYARLNRPFGWQWFAGLIWSRIAWQEDAYSRTVVWCLLTFPRLLLSQGRCLPTERPPAVHPYPLLVHKSTRRWFRAFPQAPQFHWPFGDSESVVHISNIAKIREALATAMRNPMHAMISTCTLAFEANARQAFVHFLPLNHRRNSFLNHSNLDPRDASCRKGWLQRYQFNGMKPSDVKITDKGISF